MTTSSRQPKDDRFEETERLVHEYLRSTGKLIPQTPEEVAAVEEWLSQHDVELPKTLRSLDGCSLPRKLETPIVIPFPRVSTETSEGLARAARDGKAITPEVETRMKRDREEKEREGRSDA
jgi:hypothetical protein